MGHGIQGVGYGIQGVGYGTQGVGYGIQGVGYGIQGVGYGIQGVGYGIQGVGYGIQGVGYGIQGVGYGIQGVGYGIQGVGYGIQRVKPGIQGVEPEIQRPPGLPDVGRIEYAAQTLNVRWDMQRYSITGLKITAGQRSVTGRNCQLTGHFLTSPQPGGQLGTVGAASPSPRPLLTGAAGAALPFSHSD